MTYTLNVVNRTPITIQNGATDSSTSLTLVGKNYPNYGQLIEQNLVYLLQSFAGGSQPVNPVTGQLWFNTTGNTLQVYNGTTFKIIGGSTVSTSAPTSTSVTGDFWYKSDDAQLYLYNGTAWILIGPNYSSSQQQTNATALTITDNTASIHTVLAFYVGNQITGILSKDAAFTPQSPITGFASILPGYNVNSTIFAGNITISGTIIQNAQPYITSVGTLSGLTVTAPIVGSVLYNANTVTYASQPNITSVGTLTTLTVSGNTTLNGATTFNSAATFNSTANVGIINSSGGIFPTANASIDLGSASNKYWANIYAVNFLGTSTTAKYADLAEIYKLDYTPEVGDIVIIGGQEEVTASTVSHDPRILGVVSKNPAYLMNSEASGFAIGLTGRIFTKVKGPISRGDLIVSSEIRATGQKLQNENYLHGCIVGKSLNDINDESVQLIEVVVGIK